MKNKNIFLATVTLLVSLSTALARDVTIVAPISEAALGLDLQAVSELFTETNNLEDFERSLNDPNEGLNNLDLDGNGEVDYIRLVEVAENDARIIILQAVIGKDEFQDVATIEIEKNRDTYNMQIRGNSLIYGANYYYHPTHLHVRTWPIIGWIFRSSHRPYHSRFHFGYFPRWWKPFRPIHRTVYHNRVSRYKSKNSFVAKKVSRVKTVSRIKHKTHTSTKVSRKMGVRHGNKTTTIKQTKQTQNQNTRTTVKRGKQVTQNKNGTTTVKQGKKVTTKKNGRTKTVKKVRVKKKRT